MADNLRIENIFNMNLIDNPYEFNYFTWIIVGISCCLIIFSKLQRPSIVTESFNDFFSLNFEQSKVTRLHTILLNFNFPIVISLFINHFFAIINLKSSWSTYLYVLIGLTLVLLLKNVTIYIVDFIFGRRYHFHISQHLIFYRAAGIILLPLYVLSYYLEEKYQLPAIIACLSLLSLLIIIREIKSFLIAIKINISLFYIILYLCTLEILPLILVLTILKD